MLERYIRDRLEGKTAKPILLMTHIVLGYPDFEASMALVESMVRAGVDLIELQIPFSEPIADGPVIAAANQKALGNGSSVARCLECAAELTGRFPIPFLFMSYYNILFRHGVADFARDAAMAGIRGAIIADLPIEEDGEYLAAFKENGLDPIYILSPNSTLERMRAVTSHGSGFVYCVARKGVTGEATEFASDLDRYLTRCREATSLPLALGFGVKDKDDVDHLTGKADIAVVGSQALRVFDEGGAEAVGDYLRGLRD